MLYHGVLAPHARWRARVVAYGATPVSRPVPASPSAKVSASDDTATTPNPRHWAWADLMRRAFDIDVACPRCGGRLRLIATLEDPDAIRAILAALAASARAGGSSDALRRVARYQPHRCDQRLSAIRAPRTPRSVRSGPEPSCIPVNQLLTPRKSP